MTSRTGPFDRADFPFALRLVTEAAAIAAYDWVGRSKKEEGDGAAVEAMRKALNEININAVVMIGEGEKDNAPLLYRGERIGTGEPEIEIAVDPIEGTTNMANGVDNSMAVFALSPRGSMFDLGPSFYMDKLVVPAAAKGKVDPTWPVKKKLEALSAALNKPISELRIFVLNRKRHHAMIKEIHEAGARTVLQENGDVAGAFMALQKGHNVDALFGTGGSPEGVITAIFAKALGGEFFGRVDPQSDEEAAKVKEFGLDSTKWLSGSELVKSDDAIFVATGINSGPLCRGITIDRGEVRLHTVILMAKTGARYDLVSRIPKR
ncbi:class II fructose-bisphosphatase [uncultured Ferrovibrio sp.]|jgi:fructose-1,6-bisphosphatase II|uniref:class II fructose-bisphosphatase n=1 Tax=uncultured Ferrovibrio sp. TaxID=1576913 RepID=UPI00263719B2|nr:class II fructose-bisphosphatase [uncultured Ferrovibrio sp.]